MATDTPKTERVAKVGRSKTDRIADVAYSKDLQRLELTVPYGTTLKDLSKILVDISSVDIMGNLPRGCMQCTSGDHLNVRERLKHVIRVDLDKKKIVDLDKMIVDLDKGKIFNG